MGMFQKVCGKCFEEYIYFGAKAFWTNRVFLKLDFMRKLRMDLKISCNQINLSFHAIFPQTWALIYKHFYNTYKSWLLLSSETFNSMTAAEGTKSRSFATLTPQWMYAILVFCLVSLSLVCQLTKSFSAFNFHIQSQLLSKASKVSLSQTKIHYILHYSVSPHKLRELNTSYAFCNSRNPAHFEKSPVQQIS